MQKEAAKASPSAHAQLKSMIGLQDVKDKFDRVLALAKYRQDLRKSGVDVGNTSTNMVFEGESGVGKTEVAELMSRALFESGVLPGSQGQPVFINTSPADIKGKVLGETESNMKKAFTQAKGGVLFIDEVHNWTTQDDPYGTSALTTLLKLTEDNRDDVLVILGGYPGIKEDLGSVDQGLPRRFPVKIDFKNYSKQEKLQIGHKQLKDKGYSMTPKAKALYQQAIFAVRGQGGDVRNFNDMLEEEIAVRYGKAKPGKAFKMQQLTPKDIEQAILHYRDAMNAPLNVQR